MGKRHKKPVIPTAKRNIKPIATAPKRSIIDIYPPCERPDWVHVGVLCNVYGEAHDVFRISQVLNNRVILETKNGKYCHGAESFTKLHREYLDDEEKSQ